MREIAATKRRCGCPRIYVRLRREGWTVNHKTVERIYREEGLSLRRRARKKAFDLTGGPNRDGGLAQSILMRSGRTVPLGI